MLSTERRRVLTLDAGCSFPESAEAIAPVKGFSLRGLEYQVSVATRLGTECRVAVNTFLDRAVIGF